MDSNPTLWSEWELKLDELEKSLNIIVRIITRPMRLALLCKWQLVVGFNFGGSGHPGLPCLDRRTDRDLHCVSTKVSVQERELTRGPAMPLCSPRGNGACKGCGCRGGS
jgi:hypothetical protein